ncbi:MAG: hypothetical protein JXA10_19215 [Anaerolineae bacterium]|nr:hypothetical protein [Anaerolineae bacterium]
MTDQVPSVQNANWKSQVYLIGGLVGIVAGLLAAYFYARASEESGKDGPGPIKSMEALSLAVAMLSLIRQITDLGGKNK